MPTYLIYGKVVKPVTVAGGHHLEPQTKFRALNYQGVQVSRLADADDYATKEDAQEVIDKVTARLKKNGKEDCIIFEIRKAK